MGLDSSVSKYKVIARESAYFLQVPSIAYHILRDTC